MKRTEDTCMRMYGGKESGRRKMRRRKTRQYGVARMEYTHRGEKTLRMRVKVYNSAMNVDDAVASTCGRHVERDERRDTQRHREEEKEQENEDDDEDEGGGAAYIKETGVETIRASEGVKRAYAAVAVALPSELGIAHACRALSNALGSLSEESQQRTTRGNDSGTSTSTPIYQTGKSCCIRAAASSLRRRLDQLGADETHGVLRIEVPITASTEPMAPLDFLHLVREYEGVHLSHAGGSHGLYFASRAPHVAAASSSARGNDKGGVENDDGSSSSSSSSSSGSESDDWHKRKRAKDKKARASERIVAACHGAARVWTSSGSENSCNADMVEIEQLMSESGAASADGTPLARMRVFGGARFDAFDATSPTTTVELKAAAMQRKVLAGGEEWKDFGSHVFILPRIEMVEEDAGVFLAVNLVFSSDAVRRRATADIDVAAAVVASVEAAIAPASVAMTSVDSGLCCSSLSSATADETIEDQSEEPTRGEWDEIIAKALDEIDGSARATLTAAQDSAGRAEASTSSHNESDATGLLNTSELQKVVLARRVEWRRRNLRALTILRLLQQRNGASYHIALFVPGGDAFVCCTPERLFARRGRRVYSEAVAGTRQRGTRPEDDVALAFELMMSKKEGAEFAVVREQVQETLRPLCSKVSLVTKKEVMRQAQVQHLFSQIEGVLLDGVRSVDVVKALHPTPAVCGHPRQFASEMIAALEPFDRGYYAGPIGWMGVRGAEFAVAIRSALISARGDDHAPESTDLAVNKSAERSVYAYSGVGIVDGSDAQSEWNELKLKANQFSSIMARAPILRPAVCVNLTFARAMVEELLRLGLSYYVVCPGSRSSPLALAIGEHPCVTFISCVDERCAGFHAVGYGAATGKPAIVLTSSGTATANLFPSVMEANEARVPMILLTADRPHELHGIGANQSVDQVKLYGSHVRHSYELPPPLVSSSAIMHALTLIGEAAARTRTMPPGPVHVNCMFRDPLAPPARGSDAEVIDDEAFLSTLRQWAAGSRPFVTHEMGANVQVPGETGRPLPRSIMNVVMSAKRGLIVVGGGVAPHEIRSIMRISRATGWPIVPDITSGMRLATNRFESRVRGSFAEGATASVESRGATFIHHMDQILLSEKLRWHITPDCILQIGGRIVSKRVSSFIETSAAAVDTEGTSAGTLILLGEDVKRGDATNSSSMRVYMSTSAFADATESLVGTIDGAAAGGANNVKRSQSDYSESLSLLSAAVSRKIHSICAAHHHRQQHQEQDEHFEVGGEQEQMLSEPVVAHLLSTLLPWNENLFLGNSMPIRDMDMYGSGSTRAPAAFPLPGGARTAANRGASGIDGIVSTAIGFAAGTNARTTLVIGDVSFIHDTNGLLLLRDAHQSKSAGMNVAAVPPMTIVVVNNAGGGIFSFLPIADTYAEQNLQLLWETPPDVDIQSLAHAHKLNYRRCLTADDLRSSLESAWRSDPAPTSHTIIEVLVATDKSDNVALHQMLTRSVVDAAEHAFNVALRMEPEDDDTSTSTLKPLDRMTVSRMRYRRHQISYKSPVISGRELMNTRKGLTVEIQLGNAVGLADVSPLPGFHQESIEDVERQVAVLCDLFRSHPLPPEASMLDGCLGEWLNTVLGENLVSEMYPSVRVGIEVAILNAIDTAAHPAAHPAVASKGGDTPPALPALITNNGTVRMSGDTAEVIADVRKLIEEDGFRTLKLKVGRRESPASDAELVSRVCEAILATYTSSTVPIESSSSTHAVDIRLRLDANRLWTYEDALAFARSLSPECLALIEYIEEPVNDPSLFGKFYAESMIPVALDETVDELVDMTHALHRLDPTRTLLPLLQDPGVVAIILKPNYLGSIELVLSLANRCRDAGVRAVISNTFESGVMLDFYSQLAFGLDRADDRTVAPAHGLGTRGMIETDTSANSGSVVPGRILNEAAFTSSWLPVAMHERTVRTARYDFNVIESGGSSDGDDIIILLHGFLGDSSDFLPIINALSIDCRCLAIDLPGHGKTRALDVNATPSFESIVESLCACIRELQRSGTAGRARRCTLVGYSMGGRLAYAVASKFCNVGDKDGEFAAPTIVALSASPGIDDEARRDQRKSWDARIARNIVIDGGAQFVNDWYSSGGTLWDSLRCHPRFEDMMRKRVASFDATRGAGGFPREAELAAVFLALSAGVQPPMMEALCEYNIRGEKVFVLVGERDMKYVDIADDMVDRGAVSETSRFVVRGCGHALHIEGPDHVAKILQEIL